MDFTPISKPLLARVFRKEAKARKDAERSQRATLGRLISSLAKTQWGKERGILPSDSYEDFIRKVPTMDYEEIRPYVERMIRGEENLLLPGKCRRYAQSSGTSGSKSKYIPLPDKSLKENHYIGAAYSLASYLHYYPDSHLFGGKNFILGGSYANEIAGLPPDVKVGDLSASLIDKINPLVNLFRIPDKQTALMADWSQKLPRLIEAAVGEDVRSISGVPSWFLTVLKGVKEKGATAERTRRSGAEEADCGSDLRAVWPRLEVFFHGGISFSPYRAQYEALCGPQMRYWENYNASEGFFAVQEKPASEQPAEGNAGTMQAPMGLLLSAGVFYEFIPVEGGDALPVWQVEPERVYELVITAPNGLTRYSIGDTVKVCSTNPVTIVIAGRTKAFINAFGEELMVHNAEAAMAEACRQTEAEVADYTAAPVYACADGSRGRHQWLIEFARPPRGGVCSAPGEYFAEILDRELQNVNSDYQAKRSGNLFLDRLEVVEAPAGLFNRWLGMTGKLGGQRKVPRLANDRSVINSLLKLIDHKND